MCLYIASKSKFALNEHDALVEGQVLGTAVAAHKNAAKDEASRLALIALGLS